jgi:hypothetical protein
MKKKTVSSLGSWLNSEPIASTHSFDIKIEPKKDKVKDLKLNPYIEKTYVLYNSLTYLYELHLTPFGRWLLQPFPRDILVSVYKHMISENNELLKEKNRSDFFLEFLERCMYLLMERKEKYWPPKGFYHVVKLFNIPVDNRHKLMVYKPDEPLKFSK